MAVCRIYEDCVYGDEIPVPANMFSAFARIVSMPYDSNTRLHSGEKIAGEYSESTGRVYWDFVYGARVEFVIPNFGVKKVVTVPSQATARLTDIS